MLIPADSTEYVHVPVTPPTGIDITGTPPKLAILPITNRNNPQTSDWHEGDWTNGTTARLLIGPDGGATTLTPGDYRVYVSIDPPGPENIVRMAGGLSIS